MQCFEQEFDVMTYDTNFYSCALHVNIHISIHVFDGESIEDNNIDETLLKP